MIIITIFNYHIFTITIIITILLIFIGVKYQLGHRPVFFSTCYVIFVRATNLI